jgi:hypothetical protein
MESFDIVKLVTNNPIARLSGDYNSKLLCKIKGKFSGEDQQLFLGSFYCYLNHNSRTEFIIDLDDIWGWLGFSAKIRAKELLLKHFEENVDYKIQRETSDFLGKETHPKGGGLTYKDKITMTIRTFKSLCLKANTKKAKEIHEYYIDMEEIIHEVIDEESSELRIQLQISNNKIETLTKKTNKYVVGECVYIFKSTFDGKDIYKIGRTKNANDREYAHKTTSLEGLLEQVLCVNSRLTEQVSHFILDRYRCVSRREWFETDLRTVQNVIHYTRKVLELNSEFVPQVTEFIDKITPEIITEPPSVIPIDTFTPIQFELKDQDNFGLFISECCDIADDHIVSHSVLRAQYKIWSKTAKPIQGTKLINYCNGLFKSSMMRQNQLVKQGKKSLHFTGLKLKPEFTIFVKPDSETKIIENFLYERCVRHPLYRESIIDVLSEFESFYPSCCYVKKELLKKFFDTIFIRLRSGMEYGGKDDRLSGWLGVALKSNPHPEPVKNYRAPRQVALKKVDSNEIIETFVHMKLAAEYIGRSSCVTNGLIIRHEQITLNDESYILEYCKN